MLAADVVYHHDYLNELLVTMCHFCQPGTTLIWSNKIRYQSDLVFIERFNKAFRTTVLEEKDGIRIYMATAREVQEHSGQTMQSEQVKENSGQMMMKLPEMKLVEEDSDLIMQTVKHKEKDHTAMQTEHKHDSGRGRTVQTVEHDHSFQEEKDKTIIEEKNVCPTEDISAHETEAFQEGKKQRCSNGEVEGKQQGINAEKKYQLTNLNYMEHVGKENTSNGEEEGAKIENDQKYEKVDPNKLLISYCKASDIKGQNGEYKLLE